MADEHKSRAGHFVIFGENIENTASRDVLCLEISDLAEIIRS